MDENRKRAYRHLLYTAMLDIRGLEGVSGWDLLLPRKFRRTLKSVRRAGAIADWLHNLAIYSARDLDQLDEDWFWESHRQLERRYPDTHLDMYSDAFQRALSGDGIL